MYEPLTFEKIVNQDQLDSLKSFAESFGHKIDASTLPLVAVRRGDKLFAYFSSYAFPIVFPAFHPERTTKRDFIEAVEHVRAHFWIGSTGHQLFPRGVFLTAFSTQSDAKLEIARKMGFRNTGCSIWESYPGIEASPRYKEEAR